MSEHYLKIYVITVKQEAAVHPFKIADAADFFVNEGNKKRTINGRKKWQHADWSD